MRLSITDNLSRNVAELSQLIVQILDTLDTLENLGTTYGVHLGLIGKRVVHFLIVLTELNFFSLADTAEALRAKIDRKSAISLQRGDFDQKFQVEGDVPYQ